MVPITVSCPSCHAPISVSDRMPKETLFECPQCATSFPLPTTEEISTGSSQLPMGSFSSEDLEPAPLLLEAVDEPISEDRRLTNENRRFDDFQRTIKRRKPEKRRNPELLAGLITGGVVVAIGLLVFLVSIIGGNSRDSLFDQVHQGMTEEEVLQLLGRKTWEYTPRAVGIWTSPRMTFEEFLDDPSRNREIQDVIFVYFRDGNVDNIYRKTGAEFRQPRPRSR